LKIPGIYLPIRYE